MGKKRIVDILLVLGIIFVGAIILLKMVPGDVFVPESPFNTKKEFFEAIEKGETEKIEQALASGEFQPGIKNDKVPTGFKKNYTALMYAIFKNKPGVVRVLIKNGADYKTPQKSFYVEMFDNEQTNYETGNFSSTAVNYPLHPLTEAARKGHLEIVKVLLEAGAAPNAFMTLEKIKNFSKRVYEKILSVCSKEIARKHCVYSPLIFASGNGHLEVVEALLEAGADPNFAGPGYVTSLHAAAEDGHVEVLKKLVEYGGDVDIYTEVSSTPLGVAALNGRLKAVEFLVENGANVNKIYEQETITALGMASYDCHADVVEYLLSKGVQPKRVGETPESLLYAVDLGCITERPQKKKDCIKVIKMLLEAGADPALEYDKGKTIFDYAKDEEIKQLLRNYASKKRESQK
jgi:ankyrin repeat protein